MRRALPPTVAALLLASCGGGASLPDRPALPGPELRLLSPRPDEVLVHRSPVEVRWNARSRGTGATVLESSRDFGASWIEEAAAAPGDDSVLWTPQTTGDRILLRVRPAEGGEASPPRRISVRPFPGRFLPGLSLWVATMSDGSAWFWGDYPETFFRYPQDLPVPFPELAGLEPLAAAFVVLARDAGGRLFMWGDMDGFRDLWPPMDEPQYIDGPEDVVWAACEYNLAFAAAADGRVWGWGNNVYGSVGDGTTFDRLVPTRVPALDGVTKIAVGRLFAAALRPDGTVLTWGVNWGDRLGDGPGNYRPFPREVPGVEDAVDLAVGMGHVLVLRRDGTVLSWGGNNFGQLGDGTSLSRSEPGPVEGLPPAVRIQAGGDSSYALDTEGRLWAWGHNSRGELGDGTFEYRTRPVPAAAVPPVETFAVGAATVHAVTRDGRWIAWGMGGERADGSWTDVAAPVEILRR